MSIEGKRVALTGKLRRITRSDATSQLEDLGAEVTAVVTDGTDLVIAGADSIAPHLPDVPVLDEEALEKLLSGTPLSALLGTSPTEVPARPPLPPITWQRDGLYQRADAEGRILVDGPVVAARMHGTWHYRWPNGRPSREVEHRDGLEHGSEREWNERGVLTYRGQNAAGRSTGVCEWLHDDGVSVSTRTAYRDGEQHGEHRELHPDGAPRVIGRNVRGRAEGVWAWLAPDGTQSTRRYRSGFLVAAPAPIEADRKLLEKTVRAVKKADDRWEQEAALEAIPSDGNRFVLVYLWRAGLLDLATEPGLWELLAEAAIDPACEITGAELVAWLATIPSKAKLAGAHLDGWPLPLDRAACHVFARDPEAFASRSWQGAVPAIRRGLESVLRRAGVVDGEPFEDLSEPLARALVGAAPIPPVSWFEDGAVTERALVHDHEPTAAFHELIATYTSADAWGRASLARAFARGVKQLDLTRLHDAARFARVDQLGSMIERASGHPQAIAPFLLASPLPPDALAQVALGESDTLRRNAALWAAIIRHDDAQVPVPGALVDALSWLGSSTPTPERVAAAIAALPSHRKEEPALAAARVRFGPDSHPMLDGLALPLRAARALGPQLEGVIRRDLAAGRALAVAPLLHLVADPAFWRAAITTLRALPHPSSTEQVGVALGMLPVAALPILAAAYDEETRAHVRDWLAVAIVAVLAHAASDGTPWDAAYDRFLRTDLGETVEERRYIDPLVCAAIAGLPEPRAEATLVANLDATDRERFTRAFALLGLCATPVVMAHALNTLLDLEPTLLGSDLTRVEAGLNGLFEPNEWVRWLLAAGAGSRLGSALVAVVGNEEKLDALRAEVVASGARVARALDSIDVIEAMTARFAEAAKQTVYLLRRVDDLPSDAGYNRIGGVPVGITSRKWPKRRGKPMTHMFTLDVVTMPALAKVLGKDARTVSLFVASPEQRDQDEATAPGNDWAKVIVVGAKDVGKGELAPPAAVTLREIKWFEPVPVDVPTAVFGAKAGALRELRQEIAKHPRVLGEPSWLQEPAYPGTLLVELDASFVDINLGEGGRLFVFADTAFWQPR